MFPLYFGIFERTRILAIDAASDVENGAITSYEFDAERNKFTLKLDNYLPK